MKYSLTLALGLSFPLFAQASNQAIQITGQGRVTSEIVVNLTGTISQHSPDVPAQAVTAIQVAPTINAAREDSNGFFDLADLTCQP
jgi:hypothetical protein